MTRKTCGTDNKAFVWKSERCVYVVSYIDKRQSKHEKIVTAFSDIIEAKKFYIHCLKRYDHVQMDTCRVYDAYDTKNILMNGEK